MLKAVLLPVLLLATFLQGSDSQKMGLGKCPDVNATDSFWLSKFTGDWYEYSSYGGESKGTCVMSEVLYNEDTFQYDIIKNKGTTDEVRGRLYHSGVSNHEGELQVIVNKPGGDQDTTPLWILGIDYDSLAVAYACTESFGRHYTSSWILTRERLPSIDEAGVNPIISKIGLRMNDYKKTDQTGC